MICDGRGTPLKVITTAANVNDVTQTLALVDGIPPVAGRPGGHAAAPIRCSATRATTPTPINIGHPRRRGGEPPWRNVADIGAPCSPPTRG
ncbi:hypothetical protein [Streptomyces sp. NPDC088847]|uniref:hypothetical protein n=1 Tax=Streptomyces sp. NPDC088847 TaxID=3365909 RepID=UPI00380D4394